MRGKGSYFILKIIFDTLIANSTVHVVPIYEFVQGGVIKMHGQGFMAT